MRRFDELEFVCLAGGRGKRLAPITNYLAKPLYPVGARPFMEATIRIIAELKPSRIIIAVNWLAEQVKAYFGSSYQGVQIAYSHDLPGGSGTGWALYSALTQFRLARPALVWLADVFFDRTTIQQHLTAGTMTLTYVEHACSLPHVRVSLDQENFIKACWGVSDSQSVCIGMWRLEPTSIFPFLHLQAKGVSGETRIDLALQWAIKQQGAKVRAIRAPFWAHLGDEPGELERAIKAVERFWTVEADRTNR